MAKFKLFALFQCHTLLVCFISSTKPLLCLHRHIVYLNNSSIVVNVSTLNKLYLASFIDITIASKVNTLLADI